ncbi:MAG: hypothetical protein SFX72_16030 [Isosphaeraceae bacterium]|nr:hypothetical protein [Isosphaeraceae bacterium]
MCQVGLWIRDCTPGQRGATLTRWPDSSGISPPITLPAALFFVMSGCPCTEASIREFDRLLEGIDALHRPEVTIIVCGEPDPSFEERLNRIFPFARIRRDLDGREARRFGATTSGQLMIFDQGSRVRFSGGITVARGHEGLSKGSVTVREILSRPRSSDEPNRIVEFPVFGCPLPCETADAHSLAKDDAAPGDE